MENTVTRSFTSILFIYTTKTCNVTFLVQVQQKNGKFTAVLYLIHNLMSQVGVFVKFQSFYVYLNLSKSYTCTCTTASANKKEGMEIPFEPKLLISRTG